MGDRISVVIPIYNVEKYLPRCLDSIVCQTYTNIEAILIDDKSTDNSVMYAERYCRKYPELFKIIRSAENKGLAAARNLGIKKSTGDWLAFLDSDDWFAPDFCEKMLNSGIIHSADIVICSYLHVYENGRQKIVNSLKRISTNSSHRKKVALMRNHSVTRLIRARFFNEVGLFFPEHIRRGEDMPVTIPLLSFTPRIAIVNEPLYMYFQRPDSISNRNYDLIDLSFIDDAVSLMGNNMKKGFEAEYEIHAIIEILYGKTALALSSGFKDADIIQFWAAFEREFPNWKKNRYLSMIPRGKLMFIILVEFKKLNIIRFLQRLKNDGTKNIIRKFRI